MILIVSPLLFTFGMLLLLWRAIVISYCLIELAVLLVAWCGCALALVVTGGWYLGDKLVRYFRGTEPEPVITINIALDDDAPAIELPRNSFRRLRG
jgi:hypothetical protein